VERKERETGRNGDGGKQGEERSGEIDKRKARGTRHEEAHSARQSDLIGQPRHKNGGQVSNREILFPCVHRTSLFYQHPLLAKMIMVASHFTASRPET